MTDENAERPERPVGYRIVEAYPDRRGGKALTSLLTAPDYPAVLRASGYSGP